MKGALNGLLAVIFLIITVVSFVVYQKSGDNKAWFISAIVGLILTLLFGGLFLSGRMNKTEEIHITE